MMHGAVAVLNSTTQTLMFGTDGWSPNEAQELPVPNPSADAGTVYNNYIGGMTLDGQRLDHMRTTGLMFRNHLVAPSSSPITITVDTPYPVSGAYPPPVKYSPVEGWQSISAIRKNYGTKPPGQDTAYFMTTQPSNPLTSDTGQIVKDVVRQQLTVTAPQAEAFSGNFDANPPQGLNVLKFPTLSTGDFGTVVVISNDGNSFANSSNLIVSRTNINISTKADIVGPDIKLVSLKPAGPGQQWQVRYTRPRAQFPNPTFVPAPLDSSGNPQFINVAWTEAELSLVNTTVPNILTPVGSISNLTPIYVWQPMVGGTGYSIWLNNNSTGGYVNSFVTSAQAGCTASQCSSSFGATPLQLGTAIFWISGYTATSGSSPVVSNPQTFTMAAATRPIVLLPTGTTSNRTPTYTWQPMPGATGYSIWLNNNATGGYINAYVTSATAGCTATQCSSLFGSTALQPGAATFWITGYTTGGPVAGVVSDPASFTIQ